jgi:hypothetical protein
MNNLFQFANLTSAAPVAFAIVLLVILVISFRSRAVVFCQYLKAMTGIELKPPDVRRIYKEAGKSGVREMFLDLLIRQDLKEGPLRVPSDLGSSDEIEVKASPKTASSS